MKHLIKLAIVTMIFGGAAFSAPKADAGVSFGFSVGGPRWGVAVGHTPTYRYYGPRYYRPAPVVVRPAPRVRTTTVAYGGRRGSVVVKQKSYRPYRRGRVVVW